MTHLERRLFTDTLTPRKNTLRSALLKSCLRCKKRTDLRRRVCFSRALKEDRSSCVGADFEHNPTSVPCQKPRRGKGGGLEMQATRLWIPLGSTEPHVHDWMWNAKENKNAIAVGKLDDNDKENSPRRANLRSVTVRSKFPALCERTRERGCEWNLDLEEVFCCNIRVSQADFGCQRYQKPILCSN